MFFVVVRPEDAERGLEACRGKMFLGAEMDLQYWQGWFTGRFIKINLQKFDSHR